MIFVRRWVSCKSCFVVDHPFTPAPFGARRLCDTRQLFFVGHLWREHAESQMWPPRVVPVDIRLDTGLHSRDVRIVPQVDVFVLQRPPEPLHDDVVPPAAFAVQDDPDPQPSASPAPSVGTRLPSPVRPCARIPTADSPADPSSTDSLAPDAPRTRTRSR